MSDINKLLEQIKCEMQESRLFSEDDLKALDLCLIDEVPVQSAGPLNLPEENVGDPTACIKSVENMTEAAKKDLANTLKLQIAKAKIQEVFDNLSIVHEYMKTRHSKLESFIKIPALAPTKKYDVKLKDSLKGYSVNILSYEHSPVQVDEKSSGAVFTINIPKLKVYDYKDYEGKEQKLTIKSVLKDKTVLDHLKTVKIYAYEDKVAPKIGNKIYDGIRGSLYRNESGYPGFYWKLEDPKNRLFTLAERGLSMSANALDPVLKSVGGKIEEDGKTFYIANLERHESFYEKFTTELDKRIEKEKKEVLSKAIKPAIDALRLAASNEALEAYRTSKDLKTTLAKFAIEFKEIDDRIKAMHAEMKLLGGVNSGEKLKNGILNTKCFKGGDTSPCDNLKKTLGSDPVGYRAMKDGPVGSNPDFTTMCYWKEFAKCATKLGLLPFPGDKMTNIRKLRYWPVGLIIPLPGKLVKIPMPHIWIPLAVAPSPIGTIVVFLAQCGIVPSPFVFIISNTGSKNFIVSLKGPQKNMGYDIDTKSSSDGMAGPTFKANLKMKGIDLIKGLKSPIDVNALSKAMENSDSIENYVDEFMSKSIKAIDSIGEIRLDAVSSLANRATSNLADMGEKIEAIQSDLIKAVNKLKLGTIKFPKDSGKLKKRRSALQEVTEAMSDLAERGEAMTDKGYFKVKSVLDKFINEIHDLDVRVNITATKQEERVEQVKTVLKKFNSEIFKMAKGIKLPTVNPAILEPGDKLEEISQSINNASTDYKRMMSSTVATIMSGAKIELFNPFKSCCTAKGFELPKTLDPAVLLTLAAAERAISSIISKLNGKDLESIINVPNIGLPTIKSFFSSSILKKFPNVQLPSSIDIFNINTIMKFVSPVLGMLSIPQVPFTSVPGMPKQININLDSIVKPLLIETIKKSNFISGKLTFNLGTTFDSLSSEDLKGILKNAVISTQSNVKTKLLPIIKVADGVKSVKGASKTIIDEAFPLLKAKAEAKALIKSRTKMIDLVEAVDDAAVAVILKTAMPVLDKAMRIPGSHIPVAALAALDQVGKARMIHPISNQDDLPSWDRLTLKNPLFVIFLDKFCATAADCTGIVLGRTWG